MNALEGLDDVPWGDLTHAYGAATDTPGLLRRAADGNVDDRTWEALFSSIAHQETIYPASARAAPFLVALSSSLRAKDLETLLELIDAIASGNTEDEATARACTTATEAGFARYVELLAHDRPAVRNAAARLVIRFPQRARASQAAFEIALDAEKDPECRAALLEAYLGFASLDGTGAIERLRKLANDADPAIAGLAELGLLEVPAKAAPISKVDALIRELGRPPRERSAIDVRAVLRRAPLTARPALFDALLAGAGEVEDRDRAFEIGEAILWLAFHHRLGGSARQPRRFVFVDSLAFPMPLRTGGSVTGLETLSSVLHWRRASQRPAGVEWVTLPYVCRWDFPRRGYWDEPPMRHKSPGVNIAEPVTAGTVTHDERRALEKLSRWDRFWRTDSDLPMVYGLPVRRHELAALVGIDMPPAKRAQWWKFW